MIRILHLTDFHLNKKTLRDWNDFLKDAFFEKLLEIKNYQHIDLVAFTGDLIDKGGIDFTTINNPVPGIKLGLEEFKINIIYPILEILELDISRFIICPGNHDIVRNADDKFDEIGLKGGLVTSDDVIEFINKSEKNISYNRINRIKEYKEFEIELYKNSKDEKLQTIFKFSAKFVVNGKKIGISSINSSWRCYDENDYGKILIGENQVNDNYKFIKDCDVKIALIHHQLDWVSEIEKKTISSHINKNYDVVLSGHVHEHMSHIVTGFTGSCFYNVSPSGLNQIRSDTKVFVNGFTLIDYDDNNIKCHYFKYNHEQKQFVDNTDLVDNGVKIFPKKLIENESNIAIFREAKTNIQEDHYDEMNSHFIKSKNEKDIKSVKSSFIFPPIDDGKRLYEDKTTNTTFIEIINSNNNMLFLGPQEIGKTSLLFRLIVEYIDEFEVYNKVPVYINFLEIKNKELETLIKEYTRLNSENVKNLLIKGVFILFIDNLNYHESKNLEHQINRLQLFHKNYPKTRIVGSYNHDSFELLPTEIITYCKIPFSYQYIRGLKSREIKLIMKQWLPLDDELKTDEKLDKLVKTFTSYHLPNNALSVHLYLWSLENGEKKPINQAVLMEIFVDLVLEKLSSENIYRNTFDSTNKIQLISMIAEHIIKKDDNNFSIIYSDFYELIDDYLKNKVGFIYDPAIITQYLFDRKIFTKNNQNEVRFSHVCFMHFFVAKRMQDNSDFKQFILAENRYFNYPKEIDYYTGLVRSDKDTFCMIYDRFKALFDPMEFILTEVSPDEYFNISLTKKQDKEEIEPLARNIEIAKIKDSRPSDELIEKQYDEQLEKISNQKLEIKGKENIDFDRMLLIMCNVLRNSEGIEDLELKSKAYNDIIKHNLTYSILYTQVVIRYVIEHKKLPPSIPQNLSLEYILKNIPYHIQHSLYSHLGTQKLSSVIIDKMNLDLSGKSNTNSEIEKFLSIALYSDIQGQNYDYYLRKLVKSANTVPVQNFLLFKLMKYFNKRSKEGSKNEELYLDLISDLKIRSQKLPKRIKGQLIKEMRETKKQISKIFKLE